MLNGFVGTIDKWLTADEVAAEGGTTSTDSGGGGGGGGSRPVIGGSKFR